MSGRTRRAARITAAVLALGMLLVPAQALADSVEPQPVEYPKVNPPGDQVLEPQPVEWPAPKQT
ncbi:hypothetical protein [Kribbella sp. C-35]|uniref:hypothetical protein n=1 Tax=Kribbella sp. C-35 TaxID=2789276 RepID=UPI003979BFDB